MPPLVLHTHAFVTSDMPKLWPEIGAIWRHHDLADWLHEQGMLYSLHYRAHELLGSGIAFRALARDPSRLETRWLINLYVELAEHDGVVLKVAFPDVMILGPLDRLEMMGQVSN